MTHLPDPFVYALGSIITRLISLLTLPIIARNLGPEKFGQLDATTIFIDLVGLILGFGLVQAALRFLTIGSEDQEKKRVYEYKTTALVTSMMAAIIAIGTILLLLLTPLIYDHLQLPISLLAIQCAVITGSSSCYLMLPMMLLRVKSQAWRFIIINMLLSITQACLMMISVYFDKGITGLLVAGAITHIIFVTLVTYLMFSELGWYWDKDKAKALLNYGWPIAVSSFAAFIYNGSERWFLAISVTASELGSYSSIWKIALFVTIGTQPFQLWWSPLRMKLVSQNDTVKLCRYTMLGTFWVLSLSLSLIIISPVLYRLFFGSDFRFDTQLILLLILTVSLRCIGDIINTGCFIHKNSHFQMYIQLSTAAITLVLLFLLAPLYGNYGVATAVAIGSTYRLLIFFILSQKIYRLEYHVVPLSIILILSILYTSFLTNQKTESLTLTLLQAISVFFMTWVISLKAYPSLAIHKIEK